MRTKNKAVIAMIVAGWTFLTGTAAADEPERVQIAGGGMVLEVKRDGWEQACVSPCDVTLAPADLGRPLRLRTSSGEHPIEAARGPGMQIRVSDLRDVRAGLGAGAAVGAMASVVILGVAAAKSFRLPIGCDDFSGSPEGASYPNGRTCAPEPTSPLVPIGLAVLTTSLIVGIIALVLPPVRVDAAPRTARGSTRPRSQPFTFTF